MTRLYLTQREYDRLLETQNGMCCVPWCGATEDLIAALDSERALLASHSRVEARCRFEREMAISGARACVGRSLPAPRSGRY